MVRLLSCIAFGIPVGVALFLGTSYVVLMYVGHPHILEEF